MRDPKDKQTGNLLRSATAERQARLKARREAAGFKRTTVWIHAESERIGYDYAQAGGQLGCVPDGVTIDNPASFLIGWVRGRDDMMIDVECATCLKPSASQQRHGDYYDALTGQPLQHWYCCSGCYDEGEGVA